MKEHDIKPKFERTKLHDAVMKNDLEEVKKLLEEGEIDINARDPLYHHTALDLATYSNNIEITQCIVETLKQRSQEINPRDQHGLSPLRNAIVNAIFEKNQDSVEIVKCIVEALKDTRQEFNLKDINGNTFLHLAIRKGNVEIATLLINALKEAGQEINPKDNNGNTPLDEAFQKDNVEVIKCIVEALKDTRQEFNTFLHLAIHKGNVEIATLFINALKETGQDINLKNNNGCTPLYYCTIFKGNVETATLLIIALKETGQEINPKDNNGITPLHRAIASGNVEIATPLINALKETGQDINPKNNNGETLLYEAIASGRVEIVTLFINALKEAGQEINPKDNNGRTSLHVAAALGHVEITTLLINALKGNRQEINSKDNKGWTPLCYAVRNGKLDIVKIFINAGADCEIKNNQGEDIFVLLENKDEEFKNAVLKHIEQYKGSGAFLLSSKNKENLPRLPKYLKRHILDIAYPFNGFGNPVVISDFEQTQKENELKELLSNAKQYIIEVIFDKKRSESEKNEFLGKMIVELDGLITCTMPLNDKGQNVLHLMLNNNYLPPIEWLTIEHLSCKDNNGNTPLDTLLFVPSSKNCQLQSQTDFRILTANALLEERKELLAVQDNNGNTVPHKAVTANDPQLLQFILKQSIKEHWEIQNAQGETPLHVLCRDKEPNYKLIKNVINKGVNLNIEDKDGQKPINYLPDGSQVKKLLQTRMNEQEQLKGMGL